MKIHGAGKFFCLFIVVLALASINARVLSQTAANALDGFADLSEGQLDNFSLDLSEPLLALGQTLLESEDYPAAQDAYSQALQIVRINDGLYSPTQWRVLNRVLETLLRQGKWGTFDRQMDYFKWLNQKINADNVENYVSGLTQLANWNLAAVGEIRDGKSAWYLIQSRNLIWLAVSEIEKYYGRNNPALPGLLYKIILNHYYLASSTQRRGMTSFDFKTERAVLANGWILSKNETLQRSYNIGLELLRRIGEMVAHSDSSSAESAAMMLVHEADWQLLFNNGNSALSTYQQAYDKLVSAGISSARINDFFAQPTVIPKASLTMKMSETSSEFINGGTFIAWSRSFPGVRLPHEPLVATLSTSKKEIVSGATVLLSLGSRYSDAAVSEGAFGRYGYRVSDIKIVNSFPQDPEITARVRREVGILQFRPRLVDGQVLAWDEISMDYVFANP